MKKRKSKKELKINIRVSNKSLYTLIAITILVIVGVGVFALGSVPNPGHSISELQTCAEGQTLQVINEEWTCVSGESSGVNFVSGPLENKIRLFAKKYNHVVDTNCADACESTLGLISESIKCIYGWNGSGNIVGCPEELGTDNSAVCLCRGLEEPF